MFITFSHTPDEAMLDYVVKVCIYLKIYSVREKFDLVHPYKLKNNSAIHGKEENNLLPSQTITGADSEEALASPRVTLTLLSPPTNNSASDNHIQNYAKMKCYYHHKHHHFWMMQSSVQATYLSSTMKGQVY